MALRRNAWYHGTPSGQIKKFRANSHFGSEAAAIAACSHKYFRAKDKASMLPTLIEVELTVSDCEILESAEDWGSPKAIALANGLRKINDKMNEIFDPIRQALIGRKISGENKDNIHDEGLQQIVLELNRLNYRLIVYPNIVEGVVGDLSICMITPDILRTIGYREISEIEMALAFRSKPPCWHTPENETEFARIEGEIKSILENQTKNFPK